MPPQKNWPPGVIDLTHLIERLDALEERENVRFEALSARLIPNIYDFRICGEVHARDGMQIANRLEIVVTAYDSQGRVLLTKSSGWANSDRLRLIPKRFYGFQAFELEDKSIGDIKKIRLYPKRY